MKAECWESRLTELAALERGWDSYDAAPPSEACVAKVRDLMEQLTMYPALDGGIHLEMGDVELHVDQTGAVHVVQL